MTDTTNQSNNDKIAALTKEAENLKLKLEEERQKLNDVSCKYDKKTKNTAVCKAWSSSRCFYFIFFKCRRWRND